jgi:N-acetylgalactosamine-6-sulfatase
MPNSSRFTRRDAGELMLGALASVFQANAQTDRPPNFVFIFADDLGYGDLGCYGSDRNQTPRLDRMAAEGVRFTDFYVAAPLCAPSRGSLLTGRYPFRNGLPSNPAPDAGLNDLGLPPSEVTIAEALKEKGYRSACIGKWHLGHTEKYLPKNQGFDRYYGILYSNDMRPVQIVRDDRVVEYPVPQSEITKQYTKEACDFIEQNRSNPFFLYVPHAMPHKPLAASEDFYRGGDARSLYADVMRELDWSAGQILDKLTALGLDRNTLVMFASDNGPWFGGSTHGLRGMKGSTWEGGARVPFIARWPGRIAERRVSPQVCASVDIFPTLCRYAGISAPSDRLLDGVEITGLLEGDNVARSKPEVLIVSNGRPMAIRSGRWKLHVRTPAPGFDYMEDASKWIDPRGPDGVTLLAPAEQARPNDYPGVRTGSAPKDMMLFDLQTDPSEQKDVADSHPASFDS